MRTFSVVVIAVVGFALLLCPGCKKKQKVKPVGTEDVVTFEPGEPGEIPLGQPIPITEYQEPENKEVFRDIHFDFDRSDVRPADRPILEGIAEHLKANPDMYLLVEGHCDERGTNEYNLALGEKRALGTRAFLAGLGVEEHRMDTVSYGEEDPIDAGHDEAAWAKNRRAHFKVARRSAGATE